MGVTRGFEDRVEVGGVGGEEVGEGEVGAAAEPGGEGLEEGVGVVRFDIAVVDVGLRGMGRGEVSVKGGEGGTRETDGGCHGVGGVEGDLTET